MRLISATIRALAKDIYEDSCKEQWKKYKDDHPDTGKSQNEYVKECLKDRKDHADKDTRGTLREEDEDALKDYGLEDENAAEVEDALDVIIDKHLEKGKEKPEHLADKLQTAAELATEVVDFDEYVEGLPSKTQQLAKKFYENKEKQKETAESIAEESMEKGHSYSEYAANMRGKAISESDWNALLKKSKGDAEKSDADSPAVSDEPDEKKAPPEPESSSEIEKRRRLRPLDRDTRKVIDKYRLTEAETNTIRKHPLNRSLSDAEQFTLFMSNAPPHLRRRLKSMTVEEFTALYMALWKQDQP